jgi:amino-acid N-acetyltransferase
MESELTSGICPLATESAEQLAEVRQLLSACELPTADISPSSSLLFFGAYSAGELVGVIGLEIHGQVALLRSLAVSPSSRRQGLGRMLVAHAETQAASRGVETLYLLTTSAESYFFRLGYTPARREDAPAPIKDTTQFRGLCPSSAILMSKTPARMA